MIVVRGTAVVTGKLKPPAERVTNMNRFIVSSLVVAGLLCASAAQAQVYQVYYPTTAATTAYYSPAPATTAYYSPAPATTAYYSPTPRTVYYSAPTTSYYAPTTTAYYAPTTTAYYAPPVATTVPVQTTYYRPLL